MAKQSKAAEAVKNREVRNEMDPGSYAGTLVFFDLHVRMFGVIIPDNAGEGEYVRCILPSFSNDVTLGEWRGAENVAVTFDIVEGSGDHQLVSNIRFS